MIEYPFSAVLCETAGLTAQDLSGMTIHGGPSCRKTGMGRGGRKEALWAFSDACLRELIVLYLERRAWPGYTNNVVGRRGTLAERLQAAQQRIVSKREKTKARLHSLCHRFRAAQGRRRHKLELQIRVLDKFLCLTNSKDAGAAKLTGVLIYYHRMHWSDKAVAVELGLSREHVRQILFRFARLAERLKQPRNTNRIQ